MAVEERVGAVTRGGTPITLLGRELKVGDQAPDFLFGEHGHGESQLG